MPTLENRRRTPEPPPPPFVLSAQEVAELDRVLAAWEQRNKEVHSFECTFNEWVYDPTFKIKKPSEDPTARILSCTARSSTPPRTRDFSRRRGRSLTIQRTMDLRRQVDLPVRLDENTQVTVYRLPPEAQGKAISDGPLPFVFNSEARRLKERYFLHVITPKDVQGEIWLEAFPRYQRDAAEFDHVQLILQEKGMVPSAMQIFSPGGKEHKTYKFEDVVINDRLVWLLGDPSRQARLWAGSERSSFRVRPSRPTA